ncbi:DUF2637 domain-containing protein [Streptomyces sp. NPDC057684]|uniref:DUF2637 domain-containing protein n=1 Tax=unclassified Streptomyces TaxID=2593676 RepID=UPI0036BD8376
MNRSIRLDAVLIQAVIAGALSFSHLHDLADAAGQSGWKAWAYPISVDLLMVAAWRRLRTNRRDRAAWAWFVIALFASLGANIATAGLLDLVHVPAWLRIVVSGWPALAFLGGTLLAHAPTETTPAPVPATPEPTADAPAVDLHRTDTAPALDADPAQPESAAELPAAEPAPEPAPLPASVPPALLDHARKLADHHRATTGTALPVDNLRVQLGLPAPVVDSIAAHLQLA